MDIKGDTRSLDYESYVSLTLHSSNPQSGLKASVFKHEGFWLKA